MIQFNLLPDVKLQYVKAQRIKHLVTTTAILVGASALTLMVLLFLVVNVVQKKYLHDLTGDIQKDTNTLKQKPDIDKILTIQNQLKSLPDLHNQKPVASRLPNYIAAVTPGSASISSLNIDFGLKTLQINGTADSLQTINKFVDTLKFTKYQIGTDDKTQVNAFSGVVLINFSPASQNSASYGINLTFDSTIFDSSQDVVLVVPKIITTRSELERPNDLFQQPANSTPNGGGQ